MIGLLAVCLLVKPTVLIHSQRFTVGLWRAVGQDTDLQRVLFVPAGRKEAEG